MVSLDLAVTNDAYLEGGSAHIGDESIGLAHQARKKMSADHARRGPGFNYADRIARTRFSSEDPAIGLHDQRLALQAVCAQHGMQIRQVS